MKEQTNERPSRYGKVDCIACKSRKNTVYLAHSFRSNRAGCRYIAVIILQNRNFTLKLSQGFCVTQDETSFLCHVEGNLIFDFKFSGHTAAGDAKDTAKGSRLGEKSVAAQLAQSSARIAALEAEVTSSRRTNDDLQKQLAETCRKLEVENSSLAFT